MRTDVTFAIQQFGMSERRACKLVNLDRSSYRYEPAPDHNAQLRQELVNLARQKPRYGYRRLHALLTRRGHHSSPQRLYRVYKREGLAVRRLKRKRLARPAAQLPYLHRANQEWALDFVSDALATGRSVRVLAVVDAFTRECLILEVDTGLSSQRVTRSLEQIIERRGIPQSIRCDNGLNASEKFSNERRSVAARSRCELSARLASKNSVPEMVFHRYRIPLSIINTRSAWEHSLDSA
jgi:putative transposase